MNKSNPIIKQTLRYAFGVLIGVALMILIYFLIGKLNYRVSIGAAVGYLISVGNFFFMCVALTNSTNAGEDNPTLVVAKARGSYIIRMIVVALLLIVAIKSGFCDTIATIVPLLLMRPVLMVEEFLMKSGDK